MSIYSYKFPYNTTLATSHTFWFILIHFKGFSKFSDDFFFDPLVNFSNLFLSFISICLLFWLENILCMISALLHLFTFVLWFSTWSVLGNNAACALRRRVYTALVGWRTAPPPPFSSCRLLLAVISESLTLWTWNLPLSCSVNRAFLLFSFFLFPLTSSLYRSMSPFPWWLFLVFLFFFSTLHSFHYSDSPITKSNLRTDPNTESTPFSHASLAFPWICITKSPGTRLTRMLHMLRTLHVVKMSWWRQKISF